MTEESALYRHILDQMSDAMIYIDRKGVIRLWNDGAEALFGYSSDEAVGQNVDIIIPEQLHEAHWTGFERAIAEGHTRLGREPLFTRTHHKDGTVFYINMGLAVVTDESGTAVGSVAILRDATVQRDERRKARTRIAELEAQLKEKGEAE